MVSKEFLDKLGQVCAEIEASKGEVNLFAILKMDELTDKWTVLISAPWTSNFTFEELFTEFRETLIRSLETEMNTIARIYIASLDDHLSELIMNGYKTGSSITEDTPLNGNLVHEAHILKVLTP